MHHKKRHDKDRWCCFVCLVDRVIVKKGRFRKRTCPPSQRGTSALSKRAASIRPAQIEHYGRRSHCQIEEGRRFRPKAASFHVTRVLSHQGPRELKILLLIRTVWKRRCPTLIGGGPLQRPTPFPRSRPGHLCRDGFSMRRLLN